MGRTICSSCMMRCTPSAKRSITDGRKQNPQTQPEAAQDPGKPLSEKRKAALLRYMTILFSAAFVLVLISLILQMHSSKAKISELNAASTSALSNAEALQTENRSLQDEKIALEQENKELQAKLDELNAQITALSGAASGGTTRITAPVSGTYSAVADGYESVLTPEVLEKMTPRSFCPPRRRAFRPRWASSFRAARGTSPRT